MSPGTRMLAGAGGGVNWASSVKKSADFFSGDLDFATNKWIDQSDKKNDATLVGGYCVEVLNDITITLQTARVGATITKVNDSASLTDGIAVDGSGNITIDFSELSVIANKIWNIFLSTGEEFRFTTGAGLYIYAANNYGAISGTENTEWAWSTTNEAHLNLRYGFSKYPYSPSSYKSSWDYRNVTYRIGDRIEAEWEGIMLSSAGVLFNLIKPSSIAGAIGTYHFMIRIDRTTGRLYFGSREAVRFWIYLGSTNLGIKHKVKVVFNGGSIDVSENYDIYYNDNLLTGERTAFTTTWDKSSNTWAGNGEGNPVIAVRNYSLKRNNQLTWLIKDGLYFQGLMSTNPPTFIHVPVFDNLDAFGFTPTNPAYVDAHNKAETKIKMTETAGLIACDLNDYLFTAGVANALNMSEMYSSLENKIQCDNSDARYVKNIVVSSEAIDLHKNLNGYEPDKLYSSIRVDTDGEDEENPGGDLTHLSTLLEETSAKINIHVSTAFALSTEGWGRWMLNGKMSVGIHAMPPAFWKYANYLEGKWAYDNSTAAEIADGTVIENQGMIGYAYGGYNPPKASIEYVHSGWGIAYPDGITPQDTDDNEDWWEWVIDAYISRISTYNGKLISITELGSSPKGWSLWHPEVMKMFYEKTAQRIGFAGESLDLQDDLENDKSIFSGSLNASIVEDAGVKCQKLTGTGGIAYGQISLGTITAPEYYDIEFMAKSTAGSLFPLDKIILYTGGITHSVSFAANITIDSYSNTNPCLANTWYKIRIHCNTEGKRELRIYNESGDTIYISRYAMGAIWQDILTIHNTDCDTLIKNVKIRTYCYAGQSMYNNNISSYTVGDTAAQQVVKMKGVTLHQLQDSNSINQYFNHWIKDPEVKAADGTEDGVYRDRSYIILKELVEWCEDNGVEFVTEYDAKNLPVQTGRINQFRNSDLADQLWGLSGTIWGCIYATIDTGETLMFGSNIAKITTGKTIVRSIRYNRSGVKYLRFWLKGNIRISGLNFAYYTSVVNTGGVWKFVEIPYYIDNYRDVKDLLTITAIADSYFQKIEIDEKV